MELAHRFRLEHLNHRWSGALESLLRASARAVSHDRSRWRRDEFGFGLQVDLHIFVNIQTKKKKNIVIPTINHLRIVESM